MINGQMLMVMITALFGLAIGSFLNVVVLRTQAKVSWLGRSYCPQCTTQLLWYELLPVVSFMALRGQCRHCTQSISWQYPLVESATAILFAVFGYWFWSEPLHMVVYLFFVTLLIVLFVYDLRYYLLPDRFTLPGIVLGVIGSQFLGITLLDSIIGMSVGASFFLVQFLWSRGRWVGGGDVRLGAVMGAMLGWPTIIVALLLAYAIGTVVAVILLILRKTNMQGRLPFGTCLTSATIIALLFGPQLLYWYLHDILYVWP